MREFESASSDEEDEAVFTPIVTAVLVAAIAFLAAVATATASGPGAVYEFTNESGPQCYARVRHGGSVVPCHVLAVDTLAALRAHRLIQAPPSELASEPYYQIPSFP